MLFAGYALRVRLGRTNSRNGKPPKLRISSKKRARNTPRHRPGVLCRGAPSNDGGRLFSTGERPALQAGKVMIFEEKGAFFSFSWQRSENALLGGLTGNYINLNE
jgi:hypothetical protein